MAMDRLLALALFSMALAVVDGFMECPCNCHGQWDGRRCHCYSGWTGHNCETACSGHGYWDGYRCHCYQGRSGSACENSDYCSGHGHWDVRGCQCNSGWTGHLCEIACNGHGNWDGHRCHCESSWTGHACEHHAFCSGHGHWDGYICHCESGWTGSVCDNVMICLAHAPHQSSSKWSSGYICNHGYSETPCELGHHEQCHSREHGIIHELNGHMYCKCSVNYAGKYCELTDYCRGYLSFCQHIVPSDFPCMTILQHPAYQCLCREGYSGTHCDSQTHEGGYFWATSTPPTSTSTTTTTTSTTTPTTTSSSTTTTEKTTTTTQAYTPATTTTVAPTTTATQTTRLTTTTAMPTTSQTTAALQSTTTQQLYNMVFCGKYGIVGDIAHPTAVEYPGAATCPNGSLASPESFVLKHCQTNSSQSWRPGYDLLTNCDKLAAYTVVATFSNSSVNHDTGDVGIFLECLPNNGFKMAVQRCNELPDVKEITDVRPYYSVQNTV